MLVNLRAPFEDSEEYKERFNTEYVRGGQLRAYSDSIYEYIIESNEPKNMVERYCTASVHKCKNKHQSGTFDGSCGFPFGLDSYYKLIEISEHRYRYTVCSPYTG